MVLSSTRRICNSCCPSRRPRRLAEPEPAAKGAPRACFCKPKRAVKWNTLPRLLSLSTQIFPDIIRTRRAEIERPRPVPPYFRVVEVSA